MGLPGCSNRRDTPLRVGIAATPAMPWIELTLQNATQHSLACALLMRCLATALRAVLHNAIESERSRRDQDGGDSGFDFTTDSFFFNSEISSV